MEAAAGDAAAPGLSPFPAMSAAKENPCRKFQANIFNKSKCQNCFKPRESHLLNDEDLTQAPGRAREQSAGPHSAARLRALSHRRPPGGGGLGPGLALGRDPGPPAGERLARPPRPQGRRSRPRLRPSSLGGFARFGGGNPPTSRRRTVPRAPGAGPGPGRPFRSWALRLRAATPAFPAGPAPRPPPGLSPASVSPASVSPTATSFPWSLCARPGALSRSSPADFVVGAPSTDTLLWSGPAWPFLLLRSVYTAGRVGGGAGVTAWDRLPSPGARKKLLVPETQSFTPHPGLRSQSVRTAGNPVSLEDLPGNWASELAMQPCLVWLSILKSKEQLTCSEIIYCGSDFLSMQRLASREEGLPAQMCAGVFQFQMDLKAAAAGKSGMRCDPLKVVLLRRKDSAWRPGDRPEGSCVWADRASV
ncbi:hypothetical protein J1605_003492 [Eschrichtius robustus]|uniref:Uncharacterized protein n=1 Tax=Eschrichtius robustus TaxID=9764 RepID=A0AB34HPP7_ESCRO|nr:hypothetical protein J1605_003492 [Eschrichtius robustus]